MKKYIKYSMFFMLLTSSMMNIELWGVSLNKLGMAPFVIGLILTEYKSVSHFRIGRKEYKLLLFYVFSILSALFSIIYPVKGVEESLNVQINYIVFVLVLYIPLLLLIYQSKHRAEYINIFLSQIVLICRIHVIFIFIQFAVYILLHINISSLLFEELLRGATGIQWTTHVYGVNTVLRAAGLNYDPAYASFLMIIGFVFDKNMIYKIVYWIAPMLAQSRTGFITISIIFILQLFFNNRTLIKLKTFYKSLGIILLGILIVILSYRVEAVRNQIDSIFTRLSYVFSNGIEISTDRHSSYLIESIKCWIDFNNPFRWLMGVGPRFSGVALNRFWGVTSEVAFWSVESDFCELLLGYGMICTIIYYSILISFIIKKSDEIRYMSIGMLVSGVMYIYCSTSLSFILLVFMVVMDHEQKCQNVYL